MFDILYCIRDDHDWRLVLLAALLCATCSVTAVFLLRQGRASEGAARTRWVVTAGIATGAGIWATHFVAMLGYDPGVVQGYHAGITAASLLVAIALVTAGIRLAVARAGSAVATTVGGATVGVGIAAMHYLGTAAVELPGTIHLERPMAALSVAFAIAFAAPAMTLAARRRSLPSGIAASLLLLLAIVSLHFTGMAAMRVIPSADISVDPLAVSPVVLGTSLCGIVLAVLVLCLGAVLLHRRTQARIEANEREFRILVQGITDCALYMLDADGRVASWNAGAARLKGYTAEEAIGLPLARFYADGEAAVAEAALAVARDSGKFTATGWRYRKDGSRFWAAVTIERVLDEEGCFRGYAKITRDVTQAKADHDRLVTLGANLDAALSNMHQGLCLFDADERLVIANGRVGELFGVAADLCPPGTSFRDMLGHAMAVRTGAPPLEEVLDAAYAKQRAIVDQPGGGVLVTEIRDGGVMSIVHRPMPGGGWVSTFEDITERRRAEERIAHMALHDSLTGLPNRAHLNERLDADLALASRNGRQVAAIAIDLDRFKEINDTRGHAAGDAVLKALAERFASALDEGAFVARLGGDEFAAVKRFDDQADLAAFVERLEACVTAPLAIGGLDVVPAASLGIALYPNDGETREQLLNNADLAMYRAKGALGRHTCYYEPQMDELARERRAMAEDIRDAIRRDEFTLAYQVQRAVATQEVVGYEALLRWHHPRRGPVSPADFIPVAEETGAILAIGEWVLRRACADAACWAQPHRVAVNLSPVQLAHGDLVGLVREVLVSTGLSPSRLELEITETAIIGDKLRALHILRQIKALGVTIAIDDFGTGYSSLDTLNSFPFDKIKIDRSFLSDAGSNPQARAIIRAVLALGRSLEVPVLAEGVETPAQLELLRSEGCDEAQGFLLGRPGATVLPAESREVRAA